MHRPVPDLQPSEWHAHRNWSQQAYLPLVAFHDRYRAEVSRLVAASQDPEVSLAELEDRFGHLEEFLHAHEAVEEQSLWPWIAERFAVDFAGLHMEHVALNEALREVHYHVKAETERPLLRARIVALEDALRGHLAAEESLCVPILLSLDAAEFASLTG